VSILARKARRDLGRNRWQYASVACTVLLGVALFAASYDAFQNLEASYRQTYDRLAFADIEVTGGDSSAIAAALAHVDGVDAVSVRRLADIPIRIGADHTMLGRIVELPSGTPAVNRVEPLTGTVPSTGDDAVAVERHLADHFGLEPGQRIEIQGDDGWQAVDIAASVVSPEYLWPARSRQDVLTSSDDFGVVFAPPMLFDSLVADAPSEVVLTIADDAPLAATTGRIQQQALDLGAVGVQPRSEQPSNAALQEDVAGFGELSFMFPILFLGAAAMATYIMLSRLVRAQRSEIAALRANGIGTSQVLLHYLGQGTAVTTVAGLLGLLVGAVAGRLVTGLYTDAVDVPDTVVRLHPTTLVVGVALSLLTGALAAAIPAYGAARVPPATALRGIVPTARGGRSALERVVPATKRLPARWRMAVRGIGREPRRSASTAIGVVLALTLILVSWGMIDTVEVLLDRQFNVVERQDAQLYLDAGADPAAVVDAAVQTGAVTAAEPVRSAAVSVSSGAQQYLTELVAFESGTAMHGFDGATPPDGGLVAGASLAGLLDVVVGDVVTVAPVGASTPTALSLPIAGFVDEPLGTFVYTDLDTAATLDPASVSQSVMVDFVEGADRDQMRSRLSALPGVAAYVDSRSLYETAQGLLGLFYAFVGVMVVFGAIMAFALVFNTTTATTAERTSELAAMLVNGSSPGQLSRLIAAENLLVTLLALVPGLVIAYWTSAAFMASFSSDLFSFDLEMRPRTLVLAALAVVAVTALAQWPARRSIGSLDVARVVRERSQ
jgi:putative ABC transport system permease protein